jgi:uncharacterized protein (TIGR03083 family)
MMQTPQRANQLAAIDHAEAMRLTNAENARLLAQLRHLTDEQWQAQTDCTGWTVRDVVVHLVASAQAQANPVEFLRQVIAGRPLTAQIDGNHWVDDVNEAPGDRRGVDDQLVPRPSAGREPHPVGHPRPADPARRNACSGRWLSPRRRSHRP